VKPYVPHGRKPPKPNNNAAVSQKQQKQQKQQQAKKRKPKTNIQASTRAKRRINQRLPGEQQRGSNRIGNPPPDEAAGAVKPAVISVAMANAKQAAKELRERAKKQKEREETDRVVQEFKREKERKAQLEREEQQRFNVRLRRESGIPGLSLWIVCVFCC